MQLNTHNPAQITKHYQTLRPVLDLIHFHIHPPLLNKLARLAQLDLSNPPPDPNHTPNQDENNHNTNRNTNHIRSHNPPSPNLVMIQEAIRIPPLRSQRNKRHGQIPQQYRNQPHQMHPRHRLRPRNKHFKQRKQRIQPMLRDIMPPVKRHREPRRLVQYAPVDDCHEERQRHDCSVEQRVERLKRSWE